MTATQFTPLASTIGGVLIGIAAVMLMLFNGRIAGISGILGRLLPPYRNNDVIGAAAFILGLMAAPLGYTLATGTPVTQTVSGNVPLMVIAGLLVGFGTSLWRGLHKRPWRVRPLAALASLSRSDGNFYGDRVCDRIRGASHTRRLMMGVLVNAIAGFLFGLGLVIGGMANPAKVLNFLDLAGSWDPSLAFVMAGAVAVTFIGYKLVFRQPRPLFAARFHLPEMKQIDTPLGVRCSDLWRGLGTFRLLPRTCDHLAPATR